MLTPKQDAFCREYLIDLNGTQAAIRAGYSEKTAYNIGWENVRKPEIKAEIDRRLDEAHLSKGEVLQRLSDMASSDIGSFMDVSSVGWNIDLLQRDENGDPVLDQSGKVVRRPETKLIKKIKQKVTTIIGKKDQDDKEIIETEIELYDAQAAQRDILKMHGKLSETQMNIDLTALTIEQLERIAKGESVISVLANPGTG